MHSSVQPANQALALVHADGRSSPAPAAVRRAVRGGIFGNFVDQFDIFLPVIALTPAAGAVFGPNNLVSNAGLVFVATLLGRPLGAAIFGPIADRFGRTQMTKIALAGIALTTFLIALVPGYSVLGGGTLFIIVGLRFLGGVFLGGEYTSAVPLAMEWSVPRRRGLASGLIMWMSPWANATIAGIVLVLLSTFTPEMYSVWGWRVPFLLGAALAAAMLVYYRFVVLDSLTWTQAVKKANPLKEIFVGPQRRALLQVFVLMSGLWLMTDMAIPVVTGELQVASHLSAQSISFTMLCATVVSAVAMLTAGQLSTVMGRRTFFMCFGVLAAVVAPVTFLAIFHTNGLPIIVLLVVALQVVTVSGYGPVGAYLAERFPAAVRSSGYGVGYSLSIVLPALYPYYLPTLQAALGQQTAIAALLSLGGVLVFIGGFTGPETNKISYLT
ncbi:MFS transporter [Cryobacterium sp. PH31-AA6]|uniref:MFS transporter n=1 Tax=Cryobacterium sp. PH31-AA6 TaxID=3046205 RepID=UPI0024BA861C|nr:MFS transporter [Cryobacterium sp. PH31-AA6]MDJ0324345.1 MFS transporter [Cryobacterium sp. PH31-AA6]